MMLHLVPFLSGAVTFGFLVGCFFFVRMWRNSDDGFFLAFAVAFALLGVNQALIILSGIPVEERSPIYLLRLTAFLLIIVAIIRKNARTS